MTLFLVGLFLAITLSGPGPVLAGTPPLPAPEKCATGHLLAPALSRDDYPPPPAGDRGFDVLTYDLDLTILPDSYSIDGRLAMTLVVLAAELDTVRLDLVDELSCTRAGSDGRDLAFHHEADALLVALPSTPAMGDTLTLDLAWNGRPPRHGQMQVGLLFRSHDGGTPDNPADDVPVVANVSEPWSAHSWWPCKDHPADKALVSCAITVPDSLAAVSNGTLLGSEAVEPDLRRFRWREAYPLPTYLVCLAVSDYESWSEECLGVELQFHVFPPDRARAEADFAPTCAMLEFLTGLVGPYPFAGEKYAQVEIKWIGGMEHSTATGISQLLLTGDGRYENLILHELAHHWFGDSLTPGRWRDLWLNEGFARFCEALWVEHRQGPEAYRDFMHAIGRGRHETWFVGDGLLGDPAPILPNTMVYDKGAWLLHSLRVLLGDEAFFRLLRDYAGRPDLVHGTVLRGDFQSAAETAAGRDLDALFAPWLETESVPEVWWQAGFGAHGVDLELGQNQPTLHEVPVPVVLETTCGIRRVAAVLRERRATFHWDSDCPVTGVRVDPDSLVFMHRVAAAGSLTPARPPLEVAGPLPNPAPTRGAEFLLYLENEGTVSARLYDVRGHLVGQFDLGNLAPTGDRADPGSRPFRWQAPLADADRPLPAGVYWVEFLSAAGRAVQKFTLLD